MDNTIATAVAEQIAGLNDSVKADVVAALVDRELKKRSEALVIVIDKLKKLESDMLKIRPDQESFDADGKLISSYFSKNKLKERNELKQKIDRFTSAINKALSDKPDFSDVYKLSTGGDKEAGGGKDKSSTDTDTDPTSD